MTVTMSSEGDNSQNLSPENNKVTKEEAANKAGEDVKEPEPETKSTENNTDEKVPEKDKKEEIPKKEEPEPTEKNSEENKSIKDKEEPSKNKAVPEKNNIKENEKTKEEEGTEESAKDEQSDTEEEKDVPLLDQPLEQSGKRERKNVQRYNEEFATEAKETTKVEIADGSGTSLGNIPRIDASISRFKNDDMKLLHRILFKTPGKSVMIKKNIKKFNGFDFKKNSEEYQKKIQATQKYEIKQLKSICEMLDLQKGGTKDEIIERIIDFLLEPKDSGGRPKRTAAVRANNRGYSSHDNYSSDERHTGRSGRDKGKRSNLKDDSSSQSDEDFQPPSDASDEKPRVGKRKRGDRKKADSDEEETDEMMDSVSSEDDEESEDEPKKRKKAKPNNKTKGKTPAKRGRKPAATKKTKGGKKKNKDTSEDEEDEEEEESDQKNDGTSSSEDEPLAKKAKSAQPPTDDEIKSYVKEILDGANLEEITMKNVCQKVYAHYPDFELGHKKDFIKSTVKSLIST